MTAMATLSQKKRLLPTSRITSLLLLISVILTFNWCTLLTVVESRTEPIQVTFCLPFPLTTSDNHNNNDLHPVNGAKLSKSELLKEVVSLKKLEQEQSRSQRNNNVGENNNGEATSSKKKLYLCKIRQKNTSSTNGSKFEIKEFNIGNNNSSDSMRPRPNSFNINSTTTAAAAKRIERRTIMSDAYDNNGPLEFEDRHFLVGGGRARPQLLRELRELRNRYRMRMRMRDHRNIGQPPPGRRPNSYHPTTTQHVRNNFETMAHSDQHQNFHSHYTSAPHEYNKEYKPSQNHEYESYHDYSRPLSESEPHSPKHEEKEPAHGEMMPHKQEEHSAANSGEKFLAASTLAVIVSGIGILFLAIVAYVGLIVQNKVPRMESAEEESAEEDELEIEKIKKGLYSIHFHYPGESEEKKKKRREKEKEEEREKKERASEILEFVREIIAVDAYAHHLGAGTMGITAHGIQEVTGGGGRRDSALQNTAPLLTPSTAPASAPTNSTT